MFLDLFFAGLFLAGLYFFGIRKSEKVQTESAYLIADRKIGLFPLTATLVMTEFNTATLISFSSLGYLAGKRALSLPLVFLIGLLFYAVSVAKKWKGFDGISVASYFSKRYGRDIGIIASIALFMAMSGFSAVYVKSLLLLFSPFFPSIEPWVLSGVLVALVLVMILRGGLLSIIRTDVFSFIVILGFFPLVALFAFKTPLGTPHEMIDVSSHLPVRFVISLVVLTMFTYILAPWYGQKIFAAKSQKTAFLSVFFAAIIVFVLYGLAVMSTWFLRKNGAEVSNPEQAFPMAMMLTLPSGLKGLGYAILFAASATTLSGVWSAMCSLAVGDFLKAKNSYKRSMGLTLMFALLSFVLANVLVDKVLDKLILANIPIAALSFALLAGFYWKRTSRFGVYLSMFVGWVCGIGSYLYFGEAGGYTWYWAMWGIPATFISGIIGSLLVPNKNLVSVDS